jgi:hypothetical protein
MQSSVYGSKVRGCMDNIFFMKKEVAPNEIKCPERKRGRLNKGGLSVGHYNLFAKK